MALRLPSPHLEGGRQKAAAARTTAPRQSNTRRAIPASTSVHSQCDLGLPALALRPPLDLRPPAFGILPQAKIAPGGGQRKRMNGLACPLPFLSAAVRPKAEGQKAEGLQTIIAPEPASNGVCQF